MVRALLRLTIFLLPILMAGCAPNSNGAWQASLPWTRQVPPTPNPWQSPNYGLAGNPYAQSRYGDPYNAGRAPYSPSVASRPNPNDPLGRAKLPSRINDSGLSYMKELMQRADQQELLAEKQRRELEDLTRLQSQQFEQERLYVIQQRRKERDRLAKEYADKEQKLADREKKYQSQFNQLRSRATGLDANNRDLHAELARSQKESKLLADELALLKGQLDESTRQLTLAQQANQESGQRLQALQASASRRRGNATIRANNSVSRSVTAISIPGMDVKQDGDLVRITVPTDDLFLEGTAQLHQGSQKYMDQIADVLRRHYPYQIAGIEAHSDHGTMAINNTRWRNHHQLTAAQALAVLEQLTNRSVSQNQVFVLGHGGNHPIVSSGTAAGRSMNRRIEVVVYPETYGG